ncbi:MAG TPA: HAMP domain-containing sensor histidine kinase [Salinimicrobium sp.]|nr:HAMP domain-containing sensor histidine kinase [Salinimicrobium sp.]
MPEKISKKEELEERIKELTCLYEVSSILRNHPQNNKKTLKAIGGILKKAWRFPEKASVEIVLEDYHFRTGELSDKTVFQEAEICAFNEIKGFIKVHYPFPEFNEDYFLFEELKLLNKVAEEIAVFYERKIQKENEEILKRTAQRNDRLSILGEITAGIAHELNTPLGNILGFAELIKNKTEDEQIKNDTSKIIRAAIFSREVVKKLMFFACEMPQQMEKIKIYPVIEQALSLLKPNFQKAQVEYILNVEDPELKARLDSIQLTQVIFNLIINALYFSPVESKIIVDVFHQEENLIIEIADEGPGIKEDERSRIFEPFFTTKPIGEGSGLGLSVVHGIIKSHRGQIHTFDNNPKGTIFQIKIPIK